jgi:hypothetical protein
MCVLDALMMEPPLGQVLGVAMWGCQRVQCMTTDGAGKRVRRAVFVSHILWSQQLSILYHVQAVTGTATTVTPELCQGTASH